MSKPTVVGLSAVAVYSAVVILAGAPMLFPGADALSGLWLMLVAAPWPFLLGGVLDRICIALTSYSLYYHPSYPYAGLFVIGLSVLINGTIVFFVGRSFMRFKQAGRKGPNQQVHRSAEGKVGR